MDLGGFKDMPDPEAQCAALGSEDIALPVVSCVSHATARERILYVTPEFADYVKVGGLGDVSAGLPRMLRSYCDVRVLLPGYRGVLRPDAGLQVVGRLPGAGVIPPCDLGRFDTPDGLAIYVLLCPELYDRDGTPYGGSDGRDWSDNDIRFARMGLAAADMARGLGDPGWRPDVLHLNDWPSALAPGYLAWRGGSTPTLLTIHNLAYQGLFDSRQLAELSIPAHAFRMDGVEFHGKLSFLKAGIYYASHLTTVSTTYAQEITQPEHGCGLDGLLRQRAAEGRLSGIVNGIDASWDPKDDPHLANPFAAGNWKGKQANTDHVRRSFALAASPGPLFAIISRLVHQKGVDLVIEAAETILSQGGQLVVTGRGEAQFEDAMQGLAARHPDHIGVRIGFDPAEARRMYAGSDFLLMPSRFEPCGLSQMYAQRFGSLPIAHRTGGLADTIEDGVTGFLFGDFSTSSLIGAIGRATDAFHSRRRLNGMRRKAMAQPFDWRDSALRYARLYRWHAHA
jgi:starch synthase